MELQIDKSNWKKVKLLDVVSKKEENDRQNAQNKFNQFLAVKHFEPETLHVKKWGDKSTESIPPTFYKIFRKGQILFPTRNPHLRRTVLAPFDGICGEKTLTLEVNEDVAHPKFIPFLFNSENFVAHTTSAIIGSTNPHVRWRDVANYEFLLPPKSQQDKLAELLWAGDDMVEKEVKLIRTNKKNRQIYFTQELKKLDGKNMPLSKILIRKKAKSSVPHIVKKFIGLQHIESGSFRCRNYEDSSNAKASCNIIKKGDLCYSKLRPYLDKAFIAEFDAISTTELLVYSTNHVSKEYVLFHFHSTPFLNYIGEKGFGTKMPRVNNEIIGNFQIKVLKEKEENRFLKELNSFLKVEEVLKEKINTSKSLQKSLINQIF